MRASQFPQGLQNGLINPLELHSDLSLRTLDLEEHGP